MSKFCSIPGCNNNTNGQKALFRVPYENERLFEKWKQSIPEEMHFNKIIHEFLVCEDHFDSSFLIRSYDNTTVNLSAEAYPTIFPTADQMLNEESSFTDNSNNCRFCLKTLENEEHNLINDVVRKYFKNITNLELRTDQIYSNKSCTKCSKDLKYCSNLKNRLINNQNKLIETFEELDNSVYKEVDENLQVKLEEQEDDDDPDEEKNTQTDPFKYFEIKNEDTNQFNLMDQHSSHQSSSKPRKIKTVLEKRNFNKEKVLCPECGCYFTRASLRAHRERVHLKLKNYQCDFCGRQFYLKDAIKEHLKTHLGVRNHVCTQCNKAFLTRGTLKMHIDKTHLQKYIVYCHYCGKKFTNKGNFRIHIRSAHTGERPYSCDFEDCGKAFFSVYELRTHKKNVHCDPVTCPVCLKTFSSPNTLKSHMKLSHGEKNIVCQTCGKKYHTNYLLKQHQKTHLGQKNFECSLCGVRYYKSADLNRHIRAYHMKIKLKCELPGCNSQFARKETYKNHVISHHKNDIDEENLRLLLDKIKHFQLPKIDINNLSNTQ